MFAREVKRWLLSERTAPEYSQGRRELAARYVAAAARRWRLSRDLSSTARPVVATALLRDAVALCARAAIAVTRERAEDAVSFDLDIVSALAELRAAAALASDNDSRRVDDALASRDPLYFDGLDEAELALVHGALQREAAWVRGLVDLRSSAYAKGTRYGRLAAVALILVYLGVTAATRAFAGRNLALGKPVTMSSRQPGTPDPSGLVDGKMGENYGAHTQVGGSDPWIMIDLLAETPIKQVIVFNRSDRNLNDGLPYAVDLSSDAKNFREIARRDKPFGDGGFLSPPWSVKLEDRARYVRIRANGYIALSEVEVF